VDQVDRQILRLLNQRAALTADIGRIKGGAGVYVAEREQEVLKRLAAENRGPISNEALTAIYREVMSSALALEKPMRIAYLGPAWSYTHLASMKRFGSQLEHLAMASIPDVFGEVEKGRVDYGVVPIENSTEGVVTHTLDMFIESGVQICAEVVMEISHCLLARGPLAQVRRIYSNPTAFGQCRQWVRTHLPNAELVEVSSTSRAAELAAKQRGGAAIASSLSAKHYGLRILARAIEDAVQNVTRFLVISRSSGDGGVPSGKRPASGRLRSKTSIMFSIKDRIGGLHDLLAPFKWYGINLSKIESRPSRRRAWEYYFFVDLVGHVTEPKIQKALTTLERECNFLKILGSYPIDISGGRVR